MKKARMKSFSERQPMAVVNKSHNRK